MGRGKKATKARDAKAKKVTNDFFSYGLEESLTQQTPPLSPTPESSAALTKSLSASVPESEEEGLEEDEAPDAATPETASEVEAAFEITLPSAVSSLIPFIPSQFQTPVN